MAAYNLQLKRKTASALENVYVSTKWELVDNKPSWITPNKPSYTWSEIGGKPDVVYGYCGSSASTSDKVVSSNTFTSHKVGQIYVIEFANGNTATSPTININSTGTVGVRRLTTNGAVTTSPGTYIMYSRSRTIWTFVYNGTYLIPIGESTRYWNALETKMLDYSKGSSSSAITTSDTVSSAIGKLEYKLDNLSISKISGLQTALNAKMEKASFSLSGTTLTITV